MKKRNLIIKIFIITILLISYTYICAINAVPNNIVIFEGEMLNLKIAKGLSLTSSANQTALTASNINKEKINSTGSNNLNLNLFGGIKVKDVKLFLYGLKLL